MNKQYWYENELIDLHDDYLNETYESVELADLEFKASDILKIDAEVYGFMFREWLESNHYVWDGEKDAYLKENEEW